MFASFDTTRMALRKSTCVYADTSQNKFERMLISSEPASYVLCILPKVSD